MVICCAYERQSARARLVQRCEVVERMSRRAAVILYQGTIYSAGICMYTVNTYNMIGQRLNCLSGTSSFVYELYQYHVRIRTKYDIFMNTGSVYSTRTWNLERYALSPKGLVWKHKVPGMKHRMFEISLLTHPYTTRARRDTGKPFPRNCRTRAMAAQHIMSAQNNVFQLIPVDPRKQTRPNNQ